MRILILGKGGGYLADMDELHDELLGSCKIRTPWRLL